MSKQSDCRAQLLAIGKGLGYTPSDLIHILKTGRGGKGKGSDFERRFCEQLSLWWTGGARDDVFWRTGGSGGRATVRQQRGRATYGQYGDVGATHPQGHALVDALTVELKRGYNEYTLHDLLDQPQGAAIGEWEAHVAQAVRSSEQARSRAWMLVTRRDRRRAMVWMPMHFYRDAAVALVPGPSDVVVRFTARVRDKGAGGSECVDVVGIPDEDWFLLVRPLHIERI